MEGVGGYGLLWVYTFRWGKCFGIVVVLHSLRFLVLFGGQGIVISLDVSRVFLMGFVNFSLIAQVIFLSGMCF